MEAIRLGNINVTRLLLDTDVDIHGRLPYNRFIDGDNCWTLWNDSARRKKEPWYSAKSSLFSGFPVLQWSALHIAVWRGQWQVVKLLIKRRANPNLRDYYHRAALDLAIELSDFEITLGLLDLDCSDLDKTRLSIPFSNLLDEAIHEKRHCTVNPLLVHGVCHLQRVSWDIFAAI